jgi:hypothetical protein
LAEEQAPMAACEGTAEVHADAPGKESIRTVTDHGGASNTDGRRFFARSSHGSACNAATPVEAP